MSDFDSWLVNGPSDASCTWVLAHGAGAGMDTEFMDFFATGIAERGVRVVRFEFAYMCQRRETGKRRPPSATKALLAEWNRVIDQVRQRGWSQPRLAIGGKSMGGRLASWVADEERVDALVCLGFPFHAPGKSQPERFERLRQVRTPTLIVQGTRDPLGNQSEVEQGELPAGIRLAWLEDGNHDFVPRKQSGRTTLENWESGLTSVAEFLLA